MGDTPYFASSAVPRIRNYGTCRDRNGTRTRITMAFPLSDAIYLPFVPKRAHCWIILRQIFVSPYALELA